MRKNDSYEAPKLRLVGSVQNLTRTDFTKSGDDPDVLTPIIGIIGTIVVGP